jgi:hypothetical protein
MTLHGGNTCTDLCLILSYLYIFRGINQGQAVKIIVEFTPVKAGEKEIIMNCTSDQLANINATRPIYING